MNTRCTSTWCSLRKGMAVGKPILFQFDQRVNGIQDGRLDGPTIADFEPEDLLDSLIIARRDRRRLGVGGGRPGQEPGLEFGPLLGDECDDVVPIERVGRGERDTLFASRVRIGGGQGKDVEASHVAGVDVATDVGEPAIRVEQAEQVGGGGEPRLDRVFGEGKRVREGTVDEARIDWVRE